jgi:hypothetical protein
MELTPGQMPRRNRRMQESWSNSGTAPRRDLGCVKPSRIPSDIRHVCLQKPWLLDDALPPICFGRTFAHEHGVNVQRETIYRLCSACWNC